MMNHQKLAYLQKKLAVSRTLGDSDTAAMWEHLIDELRHKILTITPHQISSHSSPRNQNQPEDSHDLSKNSLTNSVSA